MPKKMVYAGLTDSNNMPITVGSKATTVRGFADCRCTSCSNDIPCPRITWSNSKVGQTGTIVHWVPKFMNERDNWVKIVYSDEQSDYLVIESKAVTIV